jgi:hypothetical protein
MEYFACTVFSRGDVSEQSLDKEECYCPLQAAVE